jgi:hypothetical protein
MAEAKKAQKEEDQNSAEAGGQEIVVANRNVVDNGLGTDSGCSDR